MEDRKLTRNLHRVTVWRYCCCCWRRSVGGGRMLRRDCWQLFSHRKIWSHKLWKGLSCYSTLNACCYWLFLGCFLPQGFYQFLGLTYLPACPFDKCVDHDDDLKCLISRPQKKNERKTEIQTPSKRMTLLPVVVVVVVLAIVMGLMLTQVESEDAVSGWSTMAGE